MARRFSRRALLAGAAGLVTVACGFNDNVDRAVTPASTDEATRFPVDGLLVNVNWLSARINDPALRLIDCSSLPGYRDGHLPDARFVWWQDTIEINNPVYGMITGRHVRDRIIRDAGISPGTTVVAYDRSGGTYAARLIWMLQADAFTGARLLDGGLQAWQSAGHELTLTVPPAGAGGVTPGSNEEILAHANDIAGRLGEPNLVILDTRTANERQETWDGKLRRGVIPGSLWLPRDQFFAAGSVPALVPPAALETRLNAAGVGSAPAATEFIVYGLHGTLASLPWLALTALGAGKVRLYDGSWAEWGADPVLPIEPFPS